MAETASTGRALRSPYDLDPGEWTVRAQALGLPAYAGRQIAGWLYGRSISTPAAMTDLSKRSRALLAEHLAGAGLRLLEARTGDRGWTVKLLLGLANGQAVEAVVMMYPGRVTVCVSTQAGCAMGCPFCATASMGLVAQLTAGEIAEQVAVARRMLATGEIPLADARVPARVTNVVFMGMGEPFANARATWGAVERLRAMGLGARNLTISTVGIVPGIRTAARRAEQVNLAISLHAADDALRNELVPANRVYPLTVLMEAARDYLAVTHRRVSFEYALMSEVNDSVEQAEALAKLLGELRTPTGGQGAHVNLIPLNPIPGSLFAASDSEHVRAFEARLLSHGLAVSLRSSRGSSIAGACGQLATRAGRGPIGRGGVAGANGADVHDAGKGPREDAGVAPADLEERRQG
ncbi:MAG: 23S rRNA (adenine(2503)-C(2))-methyltransferase RlmN [Actinomycetota bacterium]